MLDWQGEQGRKGQQVIRQLWTLSTWTSPLQQQNLSYSNYFLLAGPLTFLRNWSF